MRDRSQEFASVSKNLQIRQNKSPALAKHTSPKRQNEFSALASNIATEIGDTHDKLQKLTRLAKRRTLFEDMPTEINDLTFSIKQSIANINLRLSNLKQLSSAQKTSSKGKKQSDQHKTNIVTNLQSKLATASLSFKDVLELRTQNMKASSERKDKFTYSKVPQQSNFYDDNQGGQQSEKKEFLALDLGGTSMQQMELIESQDTYIENRSSAIQSIESTIAELGSVFQQLAQMVSEQRDVVQRIDANVEDLEMNVTGAQSELLKYYTNLTTNRSLMIKIFAAVIFFVLIFVLVK